MGEKPPQEICCCIGQPVVGNPTHYMMMQAFEQAGLDWQYLTLEVPSDGLEDAMRGFRAFRFRGANITSPHNQAVIEFLDELTETARLCGAVNCITRHEGKLIGDNTDGRGFLESLEEVTNPKGKQVVILGAGAAARAIAVELASAGVGKITIVNKTETRGQALVDLLNQDASSTSKAESETKSQEKETVEEAATEDSEERSPKSGTNFEAVFTPWTGPYTVPEETEVLIQATSIGMYDPNTLPPIVTKSLHAKLVVADVIYNPITPRLLEVAAQQGCTTLDGLGMLINQGIIDFNNWTGKQPDATVMREAVEEFLSV